MRKRTTSLSRVSSIVCLAIVVTIAAEIRAGGAPRPAAARHPLDPRGKTHIPIGVANTVDTLKTFVEVEGPFSPGCGSYGVYFWLYDPASGKLTAPTMDGVRCTWGLSPEGYLIPWNRWTSGDCEVTTRVCEVRRGSPAGEVFVVGATAEVANRAASEHKVSLLVVLRPVGPAGFAVREMSVDPRDDALLVEGHPALLCSRRPDALGVADSDTADELAMRGTLPRDKVARSAAGDCSGVVRFDLTLAAGEAARLGFVLPVLPGRRASGHRWDGTSTWAQLDLNRPNPTEGGQLQPDPGVDYYRSLRAETLFDDAAAYWRGLTGRTKVALPDPRWSQALAAILGHAAMAMNEGAPDVAVVNYNVFNRDGVYVTNILQKSGQFKLAQAAIDYFLSHPFNGRIQVEADNPGQVLWVMGEHWLFTRDRKWLERTYPAAAKLAAMIRYCRTTPGPHYVKATSLEFGDRLPPDRPDEPPAHRRQALRPGSCDGYNPNYTEAFDMAGLRAAAVLAGAVGRAEDAADWGRLAGKLLAAYDERFGAKLPAGYGSYSVLWPCQLYPFGQGKAHDQFCGIGVCPPVGWRYFPLATAHQGLLAGNRAAACGTIEKHLAHEQMRGWYALDEGGGSGPGGWKHYRTTWDPGVAMPHGWAVAEVWLLLRDSLVFEDGDHLVLLAGIDPAWFRSTTGIRIEDLPTHFGPLGLDYRAGGDRAVLRLSGRASPPAGFVLRLPAELKAEVDVGGHRLPRAGNGDVTIPAGGGDVRLRFFAL